MVNRKPPGRPKGTPKTGGRKKGTPNKATVEGKEFARSIVDDEDYRENLRKRLLSGTAHPAIEAMIWDRAYGKVKDLGDQGSIAAILAQIVANSMPVKGTT